MLLRQKQRSQNSHYSDKRKKAQFYSEQNQDQTHKCWHSMLNKIALESGLNETKQVKLIRMCIEVQKLCTTTKRITNSDNKNNNRSINKVSKQQNNKRSTQRASFIHAAMLAGSLQIGNTVQSEMICSVRATFGEKFRSNNVFYVDIKSFMFIIICLLNNIVFYSAGERPDLYQNTLD